MENDLGLLEEFDVLREIKTPHLVYKNFSSTAKQRVAYSILSRKPEEILLINSPGFYVDAVFAGLSENQIEFIAKNGPLEYKQCLLDFLREGNVEGALGVAKEMDEDSGTNTTKNQERVATVIQYIKDNQKAFAL